MVYYRKEGMDDWEAFSDEYPAGMHVNLALPFFRDSRLRVAGTGSVWESPLQEPVFEPIITPWVERPHFNCMLDTLHFDDHSMLNHAGAGWHWEITPEPAYIDDPHKRNPAVVLGSPGSYTVTLTVTSQGRQYTATLPGLVTTTTCPSVGDCTNPAELPKEPWRLVFVDSQEAGFPGLAAMAFDGNPNTIWHTRWSNGTDGYPHRIIVDMGERYSVHRFTYLPRQDGVNGRIREWELYIGDDPNDMGNPIAEGEWPNSSAPQMVKLDETRSGRYWMLVALSEVNGGPWASAAEFTVTGCNGDTSGKPDLPMLRHLRAYPVPVADFLHLDLPTGNGYTYKVLTGSGSLVAGGEIAHNEEPVINMHHLEGGTYFIRIQSAEGITFWVKVVRQ